MKWIIRFAANFTRVFLVLFLVGILGPVELSRIYPPMPTAKKGLALTGSKVEDIKALDASWFYVYSVWEEKLETIGYVPMLGDGTPDGDLPNDYDGYVLVFNEPIGKPPTGIDLHPEEGAQRYLMLLDLYPNAKFVVGGFIDANTIWLPMFLEYLEEEEYPEIYHVHHYVQNDIEIAVQHIRAFHDLVQVPIWVTEIGSTVANEQATRKYMLFLETTDWIERYAYLPTRIPEISGHAPDWFPEHWSLDMALIEWESGELTPMGKMYRDFNVNTMYLPIVNK